MQEWVAAGEVQVRFELNGRMVSGMEAATYLDAMESGSYTGSAQQMPLVPPVVTEASLREEGGGRA